MSSSLELFLFFSFLDELVELLLSKIASSDIRKYQKKIRTKETKNYVKKKAICFHESVRDLTSQPDDVSRDSKSFHSAFVFKIYVTIQSCYKQSDQKDLKSLSKMPCNKLFLRSEVRDRKPGEVL
jgi:hypothetical protein